MTANVRIRPSAERDVAGRRCGDPDGRGRQRQPVHLFIVAEHWNGEGLGWHVAKHGNRYAATEALALAVNSVFGSENRHRRVVTVEALGRVA